jgi:POT family proton-dependent oligopeptide transporter
MSETTTIIATAPPGARGFLGQPSGMATVFFTEMWERFSYYGMRALLVLFLVNAVATGGYGLDDKTATAIYGLYTAAVYLSSLPGGWVADRLIGTQNAALAGGIIIAIGHLLLGFSGTAPTIFYIGLMVIIVGTGLLKPNVGALVAQLYPEGGYRRDAGFTMYYMSVNLGALIGPLVTGWLAQTYGWHYGFLAAAVGMILGVIFFLWQRDLLGGAGRGRPVPTPRHPRLNLSKWLFGMIAGSAALMLVVASGIISLSPVELQAGSTWVIVAVAAAYFVYLFFFAHLTPLERRRAVMMLILFLGCALFWSGFEQAGSSFNLFADRYTQRTFSSFTIPAAWFQSLNPVFIVVFAPVFSAFWVLLGARGLDPSAPLKFFLGLMGMALGFVIMAAAARFVAMGQQVAPLWLVSVYLIHTFGELCLSPVGMSVFTKLAPARLVSQSLGVWFMGTALGNLIAGRTAGEFDASNVAAFPKQMMHIFWFGAITGTALLIAGTIVGKWIKRGEVRGEARGES